MAKKGNKNTEKKEDVIDDVIDDELKSGETETETREKEREDWEEKEESKVDDSKDEELKEELKEDVRNEAKDEIKDESKGEAKVEEFEDSKSDVKKDEDDAPAPPPKPTRPLSPRSQAKKNLTEAFPTIEEPYITAVLIASNYSLEPAFNALLFISDPSVNPEELAAAAYPPAIPKKVSQLEQDELLAKQLDEEFNRKERRRQRREDERRRPSQQQQQQQDEDDEGFFDTFVEKDLPEIKAQFSKNIEETKNKFNTWVSTWKNNFNNSQDQLSQSQRQKKQSLRPFDDDPEEVDLRKFHGIQLNDDEPKPKLPNRDRAGSTDIYGTPKNKKWEPLKSTKPEPKVDDDDFLLSDDELKK